MQLKSKTGIKCAKKNWTSTLSLARRITLGANLNSIDLPLKYKSRFERDLVTGLLYQPFLLTLKEAE